MSDILATAPGKIILFGEHAVVYNRPAIAVPVIEVQVQVTLKPAAPGEGFRVVAPDLGRNELVTKLVIDDPLLTIIQLTLEHLQQDILPDATLSITSTIPLGRGLGSGAAVSTAIVNGLAAFYNQPLAKAQVSELVYEVEKFYHGTPSGIDNTVVSYSQPVYFVRDRPIRRLKVGQPLTLVIADTGVFVPTHRVVGDLRQRWQENPGFYELYFDKIGDIVDQARTIIEREAEELSGLGQLMNENQTILETLGVSSPELDQLVSAARQAGALGAKLSGAGWGGNMVALVTPDTAQKVADRVTKTGAVDVIVTTVPVGN